MLDKWKEFENAEVIHLVMPEGREWEVLEYFAEHNYKVFINLINIHVPNSPFSRKKVVEHYKDANLEELKVEHPNLVEYILHSQEYMRGLSENGRKSSEILKQIYAERRKNFLTYNGEFIELFKLADNISITSKEDYFQIAEIFMQTGLSASAFCEKYQIDNVEGFREAMERVALNNEEFATYYKNLTTQNKNAYITLCKNTIFKVAVGRMSVAEMIEHSADSRYFDKLVALADSLFDDKRVIDRFISAVLIYYHDRLNSYDESLEPENLSKMLSSKELLFVIGKENYQNIKSGKTLQPSQVLRNTLNPYLSNIKSVPVYKLFDNSRNSIRTKLNPYGTIFKSYLYLKEHPQIIMPDGSLVPVTRDITDMAECFASEHNLFPAYSTITKLGRSIAHGKLDYSAETLKHKEALKKQIKTSIAECKTLEEYFAARSNQKEN